MTGGGSCDLIERRGLGSAPEVRDESIFTFTRLRFIHSDDGLSKQRLVEMSKPHQQ